MGLPKKVEAIVSYPAPTKPKQLLGFLGALNYYRRTLPKVNGKSAAEILQPLYMAATKKTPGKTFQTIWKELNLDTSFKQAKQLLILSAQLAHPDPSLPLAITSDASKFAVGAVLEQFENGEWRPLGYWSKHLPPEKMRWTTFRRELWALQQAIRHFNTEINGREVICWTDHRPILGAFKNPESMAYDPVARNQMIEISHFCNDIRFVAGKSNFVSDWLSRPTQVSPANRILPEDPDAEPAPELYNAADIASVTFETVSHAQLADQQKTCPEVISHRNGQHCKSLNMKDIEFSPGVRLLCDVSWGKKARPFVPKGSRNLIIRMFHQLHHIGQKSTLEKVAARYYLPTIRTDVSDFVKSCVPCNRANKGKRIKPPLSSRPVSADRFSDLQIDVVGPLPPSEGFRYLLTIFDRTSRWLNAVPMVKATARTCTDAFIRGWNTKV